MDLSGVDLDIRHSLSLTGNWAFYWQTLRTPEEINAQRGEPYHLEVPLEFPVSITIGVAEFQRRESLNSCLKRADVALYEGKHKGRNRVEVSVAPDNKLEE